MEGNSAAVSPKIEMVLLNLVGSVGRWWVPLPALMGLCSCKHWRRVHARNGSSLSRPDYQSDRPNNNKITLLWDLPGLLTNLFFLGCCERMKICSLVIAWNHNCYGIWGMKFIVRNMVSRNIMVLNILSSWSAAHPRKIFNSSLISLSWGTKCSMPLLPSCPARWTGNPLGRFSKLVPCRYSCAQGDHFSGAFTGGWEALRCKEESCQRLFFQLWGITFFSPDVQTLKTLKCRCPH